MTQTDQTIWLTQDAYDQLQAELEDLKGPQRAEIVARISAALTARGHDVVATEPDPALREQSLATYGEVQVLPHEALAIPPLEPFDLIVAVGNVFIYLGEDTERAVLVHLRSLLADDRNLIRRRS